MPFVARWGFTGVPTGGSGFTVPITPWKMTKFRAHATLTLRLLIRFRVQFAPLAGVFGQGCRRRNFERIIHAGAHYLSVVSPLTGDDRTAILKARWSSEGWLTFEARPSA